ncbi:MAG TPA: coproporphyrinogen-III oxidase family protein [Thermoanaerobaculia bacterium]|nr:coproporphyrinogen-III oxidase family protein [Thermoanaerobaculia bacterium]
MSETTQLEPATSRLDVEATDVGSVFVSNYPPYSFWSVEGVEVAEAALDAPPRPGVPLGLYLHVPFCRRRCKFCYFRVFTDKNAEQIESYLDALGAEVERYARRRAVAGRPLHFVYFGGGTPSYIAVKQLLPLVARLKAALPWDSAEEVALECEPGTLTQSKLEAIREIGVTRLSLGVESFDDEILRENGRAHVSTEIYRAWPWIRALGFPQVNIDLIAGMVGETWESWRESVRKTIELDPDSVTIYQMELPFNTVYSKSKLRGEEDLQFADWATKRAWHAYAFERLAEAGYRPSSAYTMVKGGRVEGDRGRRFVYRDAVWSGADMIGAGVSSFSHMSGVHFQNVDGWNEYLERIAAGGLAIGRAFPTSERERLTREVILQLKTGHLERPAFQRKFGVDPVGEFAETFDRLADQELLEIGETEVRLTQPGLLRVDQLLPEFYAPEYRDARYT